LAMPAPNGQFVIRFCAGGAGRSYEESPPRAGHDRFARCDGSGLLLGIRFVGMVICSPSKFASQNTNHTLSIATSFEETHAKPFSKIVGCICSWRRTCRPGDGSRRA